MKIAILGATLQAATMTAILSEYGNSVYWMSDDTKPSIDKVPVLQDYQLDRKLRDQLSKQQYTLVDDVKALPIDTECYLFCYSAGELLKAKESIKKIVPLSQNLKRLMVNGSSFGLDGTSELSSLLSQDEWAYLPDTIQEGNAIESFMNARQVIVGGHSERVRLMMAELLRPVFPFESQMLWMPILDAELAKLSISGMLATRISYMNDLALVAEKLGVDIVNVRQSLASDSRIGSTYLSPGVGFGGENFSHDVMTLKDEVYRRGAKSRLLSQVWEINEDQKEILFRKLWDYYHSDLMGKIVAIWGASFKENTSSIYNSPIHKMYSALSAQGANIRLYDPQANSEIYEVYGEKAMYLAKDAYDALYNVDALCILTPWKEFLSPDYRRMKDLMRHPLILDGRNIYNPEYIKSLGFIYYGIGR